MWREVVQRITSLKVPGFFRRILPYIPRPWVQDLRQDVDTLDAWCRKVYGEKRRAIEQGEEIGKGKDIMSILCELSRLPRWRKFLTKMVLGSTGKFGGG